jgi:hypothetical protein
VRPYEVCESAQAPEKWGETRQARVML